MRPRFTRDEGFTLIELLVVIIILGILVAIAVPSLLAFTGGAKDTSAKSNLREIAPAIEAYYTDNSTYVGMTLTGLKTTYNQSIDPAQYALTSLSSTGYCVMSPASGTGTFKKGGPSSNIVSGSCL
jgi:type IV pilus assembly protein PilA